MVLGKYVTEELKEFHLECSSDYSDVDVRDLNFFLILLEVEISRVPERSEIDISTGLDFLEHAILLGVEI